MAFSLEDAYTASNSWGRSIYGVLQEGQLFTAGDNYTITQVKVRLYRVGSPGVMTLAIKASAAGKPTGADLATGTTNCNGITVDTGGELVAFTLGAGTALTNGVVYSIVVRDGVDNSNKVVIRYESNNPYGSGTRVSSTDSGSAWTINATHDHNFETYSGSDGTFSELSGTIAAETAVEDADLEVISYSALSGTIAAEAAVESASLGAVIVSISGSITYKRLVAVGNNRLYYEDI